MLTQTSGRREDNWISYVDSMLSYHLHLSPHELPDHVWAEKFKQLMDIRKRC